MKLFLEVDGQRLGEACDFAMDEPPKSNHWGPVFVHHRVKAPDTASFILRGVPPQGGAWIQLVDEDGTPVHEVQIVRMDTKMALGGAATTVKVQIL